MAILPTPSSSHHPSLMTISTSTPSSSGSSSPLSLLSLHSPTVSAMEIPGSSQRSYHAYVEDVEDDKSGDLTGCHHLQEDVGNDLDGDGVPIV